MSLHLSLLGRPTLKQGSDTVPLSSRKGQALLWYLAAHPDESFPRKHLHSLLWDDVPTDSGSRRFNTMFSRLQAELPVPCVDRTWHQLQWNSKVGIIIDTQQFLKATRIVESAGRFVGPDQRAHLTNEDRDVLYRATDLWTGPFLDGFACSSETYETWIRSEQGRWEARILHVLDVLLYLEMRENRWEYVIEVARSALEIDPLKELFHRASMQALCHQGNRAAALVQFEWCRTELRDQLGTDPDSMTMALYDAIKTSSTIGFTHVDPWMTVRTPVLLPSNINLTPRQTHPLIGRQSEYDRIWTILQAISSGGRSHSVLLSGEAGIGKTRLLTEIIAAISSRGHDGSSYGTVLVGGAYETMAGVPYALFIEVLEGMIHAVDWSELDLPDLWLRELGRLLPEVHALRPDLDTPGPMASGSGDDRLRLFRAVARFLSALPQPVFLACEDLQWADPLSLALLAYIIRSSPNVLKLAAVLTVRTGDEADTTRLMFRALEREHMLTRIELGNLTDVDTTTLVERLYPEGNSRHGQRIFAQSNGHPLYTVELAIMLRDAAEMEEFESPSNIAPLPVPPTVHDVFMGRLTRLHPIAIAVAEALAVFRHEADVPQLREVAAISEREALTGLDALVAAQIVAEGHDGTVTFKHDVFRHVIREHVSKARRSNLHRRAYTVLSKQMPDTRTDLVPASEALMQPQQLAALIEHAVGGRLWEEAVVRTRQAATRSQRLSANPAAVERLEQALRYIAHLPDTAERRREILDIKLHIANLDYWSDPAKRDARLATITERALAEGATSLLPQIQLAQATSYIAQGRCPEATAILESLSQLAPKAPALAIHLDAWHATIAYVTGDAKQALAYFDRMIQAIEGKPEYTSTSIHAGIAACHAALGEFYKADATLAHMAAEQKAQGYPELTGTFFTTVATVACYRNDWRAAVENAQQALRIARAAEDAYNETISGLWLGAAEIEIGKTKDAIETLEQALEASKRAHTYLRRDFIYAYLGLAYVQEGQYERAEAALESGGELANKFGYQEGHALYTEMKGRLAAERGEHRMATELIENALRQFEDLSILPSVNRCQRHLIALIK